LHRVDAPRLPRPHPSSYILERLKRRCKTLPSGVRR
jgi:hypothetical protein